MSKQIEIKHCKICGFVNKDKTKYGTDIFLHRGFWRENPDVGYTLQSIPLEGQTYNVTLNGPLQIELDGYIWIYYDRPLAYYNGYETIDDLIGIRYCYGLVSKAIDISEQNVTIEFKVVKTMSIKECLLDLPESIFLNEWEGFLIGFIEHYSTGCSFSIEKMEDLYYISCGAQGDLGMNCIITRLENKFYASMVNDWNYHQDFIYGGKFEISSRFADILMEQMDTIYRIFFNGKLFLNLRNSDHYDTATPFQWCLKKLKEIKDQITDKSELTIVSSHNTRITIIHKEEFVEWVKNEFKGGFADYLI